MFESLPQKYIQEIAENFYLTLSLLLYSVAYKYYIYIYIYNMLFYVFVHVFNHVFFVTGFLFSTCDVSHQGPQKVTGLLCQCSGNEVTIDLYTP